MTQSKKAKNKQGKKQEQTVEAVHHDTHLTDELLDEIDGLLEVEAEAFIKGFIQRGGQVWIWAFLCAPFFIEMAR